MVYCAGSRTMPAHAVEAAHEATGDATRENSTEASTDPHPGGEAALMAFLVSPAPRNVKGHSVQCHRTPFHSLYGGRLQ